MPKLPVWTIWRGKVYDVVGDGPVVVLVACDGERIGASGTTPTGSCSIPSPFPSTATTTSVDRSQRSSLRGTATPLRQLEASASGLQLSAWIGELFRPDLAPCQLHSGDDGMPF